jgi:hypothetical protein
MFVVLLFHETIGNQVESDSHGRRRTYKRVHRKSVYMRRADEDMEDLYFGILSTSAGVQVLSRDRQKFQLGVEESQ